MGAPYTLPHEVGTNTLHGMFSYVNTYVTGWFGVLIVMATFFIPFTIFSLRFGVLRSFSVSAWLSFLISIMLTILGITAQYTIAISFTLVMISLLLLWKGDR